MSEVRWVKIVTDIFDDEKIMLIEAMPEKYAIITCWFKLLCLAGKQNNHGIFTLNDRIPFTDEMFATIFRMDLNVVRLALQTFERFGMVEVIDNVVTIPNWEKHQQVDGLDKIREQTRARVANYRARQKQLVSSINGNVTEQLPVTGGNGIEEDTKEDIEENKNKRFKPPTLEEVTAYVTERKSPVDPKQFYEYYSAGGWKDGKGQPVKNWKQKLITWEKHEAPKKGKNAPISGDPVRADDVRRFLDGL